MAAEAAVYFKRDHFQVSKIHDGPCSKSNVTFAGPKVVSLPPPSPRSTTVVDRDGRKRDQICAAVQPLKRGQDAVNGYEGDGSRNSSSQRWKERVAAIFCFKNFPELPVALGFT